MSQSEDYGATSWAARRARGESAAPKPELRFGEAADQWLDGPVLDLRETTQVKYRCIVNEHLRPRFETRRPDAVTADDLASPVREMRAEGKSEATIAVALGVVGRIYKFAARRLGWSETISTTLMLSSERPKVSLAKRRPIFTGEQLEQTIAAAHEPFQTLFTVVGAISSLVQRSIWKFGDDGIKVLSLSPKSHIQVYAANVGYQV